MASNLARIGRFGINRLARSQEQVRHAGIFTKYREPPNGFMFNRKPLKPGEKREWEDWQFIWTVGLGGCFSILFIGHYFRTEPNLLDWARKEAEIRIDELEGRREPPAGHTAG